MRLGQVDDRRAAYPTEAAAVAGSGLVVRQQVLALHPLEVAAQHPRPAAERRALLLAASRTMAIERAQQWPRDLEFDAAAQAASAQHRLLPPFSTIRFEIEFAPTAKSDQ